MVDKNHPLFRLDHFKQIQNWRMLFLLAFVGLFVAIVYAVYRYRNSSEPFESEDPAYAVLGTLEWADGYSVDFTNDPKSDILFATVDGANRLGIYSQNLKLLVQEKLPHDFAAWNLQFTKDDQEIILFGKKFNYRFDIKAQTFSRADDGARPRFEINPYSSADGKKSVEYKNFGTSREPWWKLMLLSNGSLEKEILDIREVERENKNNFVFVLFNGYNVWYIAGTKMFVFELTKNSSSLAYDFEDPIISHYQFSPNEFLFNCGENLLKVALNDDRVDVRKLSRKQYFEEFVWIDESRALGFRNGTIKTPADIVSIKFGEGEWWQRKIIAKTSLPILHIESNQLRDTFLFFDRAGIVTFVKKTGL